MDPLSDVLSLLKLRGYGAGGFDAAGAWAVQFGPFDGIKFHAVLKGTLWATVEGEAPVRVQAGDAFLLARGRPFCFATDLSVAPIDYNALPPRVFDGSTAIYNGGGETMSVGAFFSLAEPQADLLVNLLPPLIHIGAEQHRDTLRWCVERMREELRDPQPGGVIVAQQLATMMLVEVLRIYLTGGRQTEVGWLFALADPRIRAAIHAMHLHPGRRWTLQMLAEQAAMSRTTFALTFRRTVGSTPIDYLTRWRMLLATERLASSRDTIAEIAFALGYESEKAFSTAFKRLMGSSPRQLGRSRGVGGNAAPPAEAMMAARS